MKTIIIIKKNEETKITDEELKIIQNYNLTHTMCYNKVQKKPKFISKEGRHITYNKNPLSSNKY